MSIQFKIKANSVSMSVNRHIDQLVRMALVTAETLEEEQKVKDKNEEKTSISE